jgi:hypothetical protein
MFVMVVHVLPACYLAYPLSCYDDLSYIYLAHKVKPYFCNEQILCQFFLIFCTLINVLGQGLIGDLYKLFMQNKWRFAVPVACGAGKCAADGPVVFGRHAWPDSWCCFALPGVDWDGCEWAILSVEIGDFCNRGWLRAGAVSRGW